MKGAYGILLVVVLVLVSGLIAYLGDILGRRLGRRRITIFGLRPRYTAIVISVVAGMAITLLTLVVAAALSEKVRIGLTQVDVMRSQVSDLEGKLRASRSALASAEEASRAAVSRLSEANRQMSEVSSKLQKADARLKAVNGELERTTARLSQSQQRLQQVEAQLEKTDAELKRGLDAAFEQGRKSLEIERQRNELAKQKGLLSSEVDGLKEQAKSLKEERDLLKAEVARLTTLVGATAPILTEEVIFEVGEELGREKIEGSQPVAAIRQELEQFVHSLERTVRRAGAREDENGRALVLARVLTQEGNHEVRVYEDSEVMEMLARQIHAPSGSVIVRAFCLLNVPRGRPVAANLTVIPNRLLFSKGERLGKITLNPSKPEAELLVEVVEWLREKVATRARDENILPDLPLPGEKAFLFGTSRNAVGRISPDRLLSLLKEVKHYHSPVTVVARAAQDTWTAGPLEVELGIGDK